jgi:hypothetical protein
MRPLHAACFLVSVGFAGVGRAEIIVDDFTSGPFEEVRENGDRRVTRLTQTGLPDVLGSERHLSISHFTTEDSRFVAGVDTADDGMFYVQAGHFNQEFQLSYGSIESPLHLDLQNAANSVIVIDFKRYDVGDLQSGIPGVSVSAGGTNLAGNLPSPIRMFRTRLGAPIDERSNEFSLFFPVAEFMPAEDPVNLSNVFQVTFAFASHAIGDSFAIDRIRLVPESLGLSPIISFCFL